MKHNIICIVGNPNCGKTTLFNALTGSRQEVGNWPGVTVDKKTGRYSFEGEEVEIEAGKSYTAKVATGLLGAKSALSDDGYTMPAIRLAWSDADSAYEGRGLDAGTYDLTVSGKPAGSIAVDKDGATYVSVAGGKACPSCSRRARAPRRA